MLVPMTIVFIFCIFCALGHNVYSNSEQNRALPNSRSVFVCKRPAVPWLRDLPPRPRIINPARVCDGKVDCPLGDDETCTTCGDPPHVPSSFRTDSQTFFPTGAVVTYSCHSGFVLGEVESVICDRSGSWSKAPSCKKQCDPIPQLVNGLMDTYIETLVTGAVVTFSCVPGFAPLRNNFLRCDSSGSWFGTPVCQPVCPVSNLPTVANAQRQAVTDPLTVGMVVTYTCNSGYSPAAGTNSIFTCDRNGQWTGNAACLPFCLVSNLPTVVNAQRQTLTDPLTAGSSAIYSCKDGFAPAPGTSTTFTCDANGQWTGTAACLPICPVSNLPPVVHAQHPTVTDPLTVGTVITYICEDGYIPTPGINMSFTCDSFGQWSGIATCLPVCSVASVPVVTNAKHSVVIAPLAVGTLVTYICDTGYSPATESKMSYTCDEMRQWNGSASCLPRCTNPVNTSDGRSWRLCDGDGPGFSNPKKGRIEVQVDGVWGTVCDDGVTNWRNRNLDIACKTFGYSGSNGLNRRAAFFGQGVGPIHMDDVSCTGTEAFLTQCPYTRISNCNHCADQGVECL
ncbi:sushi, von Willebrand factor type A, EGF and pentraxin domain-containing protein 1-like [Dreissena polymorpha]|uniref:Sushi, von Willebrand factor type A, EGF and pentraxin domain-containing protein 1-like n=1 Tax=Dreissena polymorpha TaxID=45954 RepID=A0A9D4S1G0_DREPO|nr:sushi, von Willebrand factor type A, EGF and pentraxin domain-containing protein 1-like [Dreissena polymorpha]KAH3886337.1 hypothetical protein DPMN_010343 [Dreissena polymorpha]